MVVILGDFNATSPTWTCGVDQYNTAGKSLQPLALRYNLKQCVDFPTHIQHDGSLGSTLDLCFTNNVQAICKVTSLPPLGQSDHTMVGCSIDLTPAKSQPVHPNAVFFSTIMLILRWLTRNSRPSIGLKSQQPPLLIVHGTDGSHCFSLLWTNISLPNWLEPQKNKPPWLDKPLKVQIRQKHLAWKEYKRTRSLESLSNFRLIRKK